MILHEHLFVFRGDDEHLLLLLAILSDGRSEHRNPAMTGGQILGRIAELPSPPHPSLPTTWPSHGKLVRALERLRKQGLVTGRRGNEENVRVWNLTPAGWRHLGKRAVFDPADRRAA